MSNKSEKKKMIPQEWEKKAKEVYQDSLKIFKEGFHGVEVMAGKTFELTRLKVNNQRNAAQIKRLLSDLGQRVFDILSQQSVKTFKVSPDMASYVDQIKKLQKQVEQNEKYLNHLTIVQKSKKKSSKKKKNES